MNSIFQTAFRRYVHVFFNDILIYSPSWTKHLQDLEEVLSTLHKHKLFAKLSKCMFGLQEVEYLGHIVSANGVHMDKIKVDAILQWPTPSNVKQLRGFLGLSGYYRRFIKQYAHLARPLTDLLKRDNFQWNSQADAAFHTLKLPITSAPILRLPDFSKPFVIETDASGSGIGAVLSQHGETVSICS